MKHITYLFFVFFTCINASKAQVSISTRDLDGTKWQYLDYKDIYEYQNGKKIWHRSNNSTFTYQYYLSNTIPRTFDSSKVGSSTQGRYLIEYNPKQDIFYSYSILRFDKKEKIMTLRLDTKNVIGNSGAASFRLIYSPKSKPKSTYDNPVVDRVTSKEDDVLKRDTSTGKNTSTSGKTSTSGNSSTGKSTSTGGGTTIKAQTSKYVDPNEQLTPRKE